MKNKHEILLGLTTTRASNYREKIKEMKKFGIRRIALFPTFLKIDQRRKLYTLLETIEGLELPHVHLREQDTEKWEMEWFEKHGAITYNIHMNTPVAYESLQPFKHKIYIENHIIKSIPLEKIEAYAGICIDFQHWEYAKKRHPDVAEKTKEQAKKFLIGCCHISALPKWKNLLFRLVKCVGGHYLISLDEIDYIKKYSKYFPELISIELENSFEEQLKIKEYLEKIINNE